MWKPNPAGTGERPARRWPLTVAATLHSALALALAPAVAAET